MDCCIYDPITGEKKYLEFLDKKWIKYPNKTFTDRGLIFYFSNNEPHIYDILKDKSKKVWYKEAREHGYILFGP